MSRLVDILLGFVIALCGLLGLRSAMTWIWWDLVVGAFRFTAADRPISFALSVGLILAGFAIAVGETAIWLHLLREDGGEDRAE